MLLFYSAQIILGKGVYTSRKEISTSLSELLLESCTKRDKLWIWSLHTCCHKQLTGFWHVISHHLKLNKYLRYQLPQWSSGKPFALHAGNRGSIPGSDRRKVVKTVSDSSTAKRSETGVRVMGPWWWPL